jgi:UDP-glucuronate 4-epimerase
MRFVELIGQACGQTPLLDLQPMQPGDVTATWADIAPARADLGYDPATPLDAGIRRFIAWYRGWAGV